MGNKGPRPPKNSGRILGYGLLPMYRLLTKVAFVVARCYRFLTSDMRPVYLRVLDFFSRAFPSFCIFLSGLCLGWLVGLSVSPVVQALVTALVAVVVAALGFAKPAANQTSSTPPGQRPTPAPATPQPDGASLDAPGTEDFVVPRVLVASPMAVALLMLGIVVGTILGIQARTKSWLSPTPSQLAASWNDLGLDHDLVARRILDDTYPARVESRSDDTEKDRRKILLTDLAWLRSTGLVDARIPADLDKATQSLVAARIPVDFEKTIKSLSVQLRQLKAAKDEDKPIYHKAIRRILETAPNERVRKFAIDNQDQPQLLISLAEVLCSFEE